jgi:predicted restriction endonuclease
MRDVIWLTLLRSISRRGRLVLRHTSSSFISDPIAQLQRQLEQFRGSHPHRTRLPESLWQSAVELAREHGLYSVAHPLRLDYAQLKKRLGGVVQAPKRAASPAFVNRLRKLQPLEFEPVR